MQTHLDTWLQFLHKSFLHIPPEGRRTCYNRLCVSTEVQRCNRKKRKSKWPRSVIPLCDKSFRYCIWRGHTLSVCVPQVQGGLKRVGFCCYFKPLVYQGWKWAFISTATTLQFLLPKWMRVGAATFVHPGRCDKCLGCSELFSFSTSARYVRSKV